MRNSRRSEIMPSLNSACLALTVLAAIILLPSSALSSSIRKPAPDSHHPCDMVRCRGGTSCKLDEMGRPRCVEGECFAQCNTLIYNPICGSDNKTYGDICQLEAASCNQRKIITRLHDGPCSSRKTTKKPKQCPHACPQYIFPVCGSDGKTYGNVCFLNIANCERGVTKFKDGKCDTNNDQPKECPDLCTQQYDPVCGSDGKTYGNECQLNAVACIGDTGLVKKYKGECSDSTKKPRECPEFCPEIYEPVCGSDGQMYGNECMMNSAACKKGIKITKRDEDECESKPTTPLPYCEDE